MSQKSSKETQIAVAFKKGFQNLFETQTGMLMLCVKQQDDPTASPACYNIKENASQDGYGITQTDTPTGPGARTQTPIDA